MNNNTIMELINKIRKRNDNKKKTKNKIKMNKIFKTNKNKSISLWNENSLLQEDREEVYNKIFNKN